jgi:hypothetical protein
MHDTHDTPPPADKPTPATPRDGTAVATVDSPASPTDVSQPAATLRRDAAAANTAGSVPPRQYETLWRNKFLTVHAATIDDMIDTLSGAVAQLREYRDAGVVLGYGAENDYATLITADPSVAERFGFEESFNSEDEEDVEYEEDEEDEEYPLDPLSTEQPAASPGGVTSATLAPAGPIEADPSLAVCDWFYVSPRVGVRINGIRIQDALDATNSAYASLALGGAEWSSMFTAGDGQVYQIEMLAVARRADADLVRAVVPRHLEEAMRRVEHMQRCLDGVCAR